MRKIIAFFIQTLVFFSVCARLPQEGEWTWRYKKIVSLTDRQLNHDKRHLVFSKNEVPLFTQLIFSWNSFRPKKGYFRFHCQTRDAKTKKWSPWYCMGEWGATAQRSFCIKNDQEPQFHHVRLEMPQGRLGDSFKIKIEPVHQADLTDVCALFVTLSNFSVFRAHSADFMFKNLESCTIKGCLPALSQMTLNHPKKEVLCSPTACSILLTYWMNKKVDPVFFAAHAFDAGLDAYGSWPFNMASAFELGDGFLTWQVTRLRSFKDLHGFLVRSIPVAVSVRGCISGAPQEYKNGHLMCVYGFDAQRQVVLCIDPAFDTDEKTSVSYPLYSFLAAWDKSRRLAYLAEPLQSPFIPVYK